MKLRSNHENGLVDFCQTTRSASPCVYLEYFSITICKILVKAYSGRLDSRVDYCGKTRPLSQYKSGTIEEPMTSYV